MSKVKKSAAMVSVRNPTVARARIPKASSKTTHFGSKRSRPVIKPEFVIKSLDPIRKCGPETSVQFLYRVDEWLEGRTTPHLVFFDRHGWYCEHGRSCPAVAPARKFTGHAGRCS